MANVSDIESIQRTICTEIETLLSLTAGSIEPDTDLAKVGMDSLRFISLLLVIEEKCGVNLLKTGLKGRDTQSVRSLSAAIVSGQHP
jgi:acyl carrier protein